MWFEEKPWGHQLTLSAGLYPPKPKAAAARLFNSISKPSPAPSHREQVRLLAVSNHISLVLSEKSSWTRGELDGCHIPIPLCSLFPRLRCSWPELHMNKITQPTRLATQELQLPDPCLIFILCFFFFYSLNSPHGQRHAQTESAEAGVAIRFTEREGKKITC